MNTLTRNVLARFTKDADESIPLAGNVANHLFILKQVRELLTHSLIQRKALLLSVTNETLVGETVTLEGNLKDGRSFHLEGPLAVTSKGLIFDGKLTLTGTAALPSFPAAAQSLLDLISGYFKELAEIEPKLTQLRPWAHWLDLVSIIDAWKQGKMSGGRWNDPIELNLLGSSFRSLGRDLKNHFDPPADGDGRLTFIKIMKSLPHRMVDLGKLISELAP
jgi:hypothetical protein